MTRVWAVTAAMILSVLGAWALTPDRLAAGRSAFSLDEMVPDAIGEWRLDESMQPVLPRNPEENDTSLAARIYDQTLVRTYGNGAGEYVMLVIAYGRDQSDALQLHLPEVCYASQGFAVKSAGSHMVDLDDDSRLQVVRLETRRGRRNEPVTYWTRVGDRVAISTLSRQWAKLVYGIRGKVPDGVLVRVSMIANRNERAFAAQDDFLRAFFRSMDRKNRRFFLGAAS